MSMKSRLNRKPRNLTTEEEHAVQEDNADSMLLRSKEWLHHTEGESRYVSALTDALISLDLRVSSVPASISYV